MKGPLDHQHMALVGAGVILSAVALFVATPGTVAAAGVCACRVWRGRPAAGVAVVSGGVFAQTVGEVRHVVGIMLRVALGYLGPSRIRGMGSRPLGTNPNHLGLVAVDNDGGADGDTKGQAGGPEF